MSNEQFIDLLNYRRRLYLCHTFRITGDWLITFQMQKLVTCATLGIHNYCKRRIGPKFNGTRRPEQRNNRHVETSCEV